MGHHLEMGCHLMTCLWPLRCLARPLAGPAAACGADCHWKLNTTGRKAFLLLASIGTVLCINGLLLAAAPHQLSSSELGNHQERLSLAAVILKERPCCCN